MKHDIFLDRWKKSRSHIDFHNTPHSIGSAETCGNRHEDSRAVTGQSLTMHLSDTKVRPQNTTEKCQTKANDDFLRRTAQQSYGMKHDSLEDMW